MSSSGDELLPAGYRQELRQAEMDRQQQGAVGGEPDPAQQLGFVPHVPIHMGYDDREPSPPRDHDVGGFDGGGFNQEDHDNAFNDPAPPHRAELNDGRPEYYGGAYGRGDMRPPVFYMPEHEQLPHLRYEMNRIVNRVDFVGGDIQEILLAPEDVPLRERARARLIGAMAALERHRAELRDILPRIVRRLHGHGADHLEVQEAETHCENALYGIDRSVGDINAALQRRARTPTPPPQGAILRPGPHEFREELAVPHPLDTIKLPLHELPKFNGHYADWPAFWDQFRNTVHERRIGDTTKLSYLKNCLTGEAYDLIKGLRLVDGSYEIALRLLRQRFEDPKMILRELLDGLFAVSQAQPNNYASLRRVVSTFQEKITGLREIGYDAGFVVLTHLLVRKLDLETRRAWETAQVDASRWDDFKKEFNHPGDGEEGEKTQMQIWDEEFDNLMAFLVKRLQLVERCGFRDQTRKAQTAVTKFAAAASPADPSSTPKKVSASGSSPAPLSAVSAAPQAQRNFGKFGAPGPSVSTRPRLTACPNCNKPDHFFLSKCPDFLKMNLEQRRDKVRQVRACYNCLSTLHRVGNCSSTFGCRECGKKGHHHSLLHPGSGKPAGAAATLAPEPVEPKQVSQAGSAVQPATTPPSTVTTESALLAKGAMVFLCTAKVQIQAADGSVVEARAMFDTGSQVDLITSELAARIGTPKSGETVLVQGIGGGEVQTSQGQITFDILIPGDKARPLTCHILQNVVGDLPTCRLTSKFLNQFTNYKLADPSFHTASKIDLLVGMGHYNEFVLPDRVQLESVYLQHTVFGWAVTGKPFVQGVSGTTPGPLPLGSHYAATCPAGHLSNDSTSYVCGVVADNGLLEFQRFWETEEAPDTTTQFLSSEAKFCVTHYNNTTRYDPDGRSRVALPFKPDAPTLGNSKAQALRRFLSLEARLKADDKFRDAYQKFMAEFIDMGHLELVPTAELDLPDHQTYYLPHHGVLKESSTTTKLRVVFDASAVTTSGVSLNETLAVGPRIQPVIFSILVRFRFYVIAMAADVAKMYRQVGLDDAGKDFHRLFWRDDPAQPIQTYRMARVTYGVTSSSYHAIRTLQDATVHCDSTTTASALTDSFYVDDFLGGANSVSEALALRADMVQALQKVQFPIRKWCTSSREVLDTIPEDDRETATVEVAADEKGVKTLGIGWNMQTDKFLFIVPNALREHPALKTEGVSLTRRKLLSAIATVYDPLGWLSPVTIQMKILFQDSWDDAKSWNDRLPAEVCDKFKQWVRQLLELEWLSLPRRALSTLPATDRHYNLTLFCDASEKAMAACVYVVTPDSTEPTSRLLCAKTKLAPRKTQSVPRLELGAMVLGAKLLLAVQQALRTSDFLCTSVEAYTDSTVALCWVHSSPSKWSTFVANRVATIQELVPAHVWYHVPGKDNPADLGTRGNVPSLTDNKLWWEGPEMLLDSSLWPEQPDFIPDAELPEQKRTKSTSCAVSVPEKPVLPVDDALTFHKLLRVATGVAKIRNKLKSRKAENAFRDGLVLLVTQEQKRFFAEELRRLHAGKEVLADSPLKRLSPFIHEDGTMRLGGRLKNSLLPEDTRNPFILPKKSRLTRLILKDLHEKLLHAGTGPLMVEFQMRFWATGATSLVRQTLHDCTRCARYNVRAINPLMGNLPAPRVNPSPPFTHTGIDYAGPITVKKDDGKTTDKAYLLIFVCFATKAVHIEVTLGLDIAETMMALRRFMGRRGVPECLYSDNGTGLMGARGHLIDFSKLFAKKHGVSPASDELLKLGVNWTTIPPIGPHMGGIWEAAVKSAKGLLKRQFARTTLNVVQLQTCMAEVEGILNSRPLAKLREDGDGIVALTPAMLLTGFKHRMFPVLPGRKPAELAVSKNPVQRYRYLQSLIHQFWRQWKEDYLALLQTRQKWLKNVPNYKAGDLVLIQDADTATAEWPLAVITKVYPGTDGIVRAVTVRTAKGTYDRPVTRLRRMPVELELTADELADCGPTSDATPEAANQQ